jgi:uncharacterized membrane protein
MTAMTGSLTALAVAAFAFVSSHLALPVPAVRRQLTAVLGENGYLVFYSVLSLVLFAWVVAAYAAAPETPLWTAPTALRHLALSVMLPAVLLAVCGYTQRNPTAVVLDRFAGEQPYGITRVSRHPVMWGVGLWAIAHIIANDDATSLILFLAIGFLAFAGAALIDRRRAETGGEAWRRLKDRTSNLPFAALAQGRAGAGLARTVAEIGAWRLLLGATLYAAFIFAHPWIAGVPAFRP